MTTIHESIAKDKEVVDGLAQLRAAREMVSVDTASTNGTGVEVSGEVTFTGFEKLTDEELNERFSKTSLNSWPRAGKKRKKPMYGRSAIDALHRARKQFA